MTTEARDISPRTILAWTLAIIVWLSAPVRAQTLGAYDAALTETSISGISSGAYMAVQFATAWSSFVKGVGVIAGGPYGCSGGSAATALSTCMDGQPAANMSALSKLPDRLAAKGQIDSPTHIATQKIYLFSGYNDAVVNRSVTDWLQALYEKRLAGHAGNLFYQTAIGAGHAQVTLDFGGACSENGGDYINRCHYDQAGILLQHIYGALNPPNRGTLIGTLISFDQGAYTAPAKPADESMGAKGFLFVPADCAAGAACRVHVALHGCKQSYDTIGDAFVRHAGYNEWADTNHIVVLYPQTTPSNGIAPFFGITNPDGCWDWWGYLDPDPTTTPRFLTKTGPQIAAFKRMIDRLTSAAKPPERATAPAAQTLVATDASDTAIALAWTRVPDAQAYEVFRSAPGDAATVNIATVTGLSFGDSGLKPASTYSYQIRPVLSFGPGPLTSPVMQRTRTSPP
ncbi:plasmid partitioning protein [Rhodopila sp.]|uniref:extracellular catalytic domain type 2 short-chain-length polyhydroxyalkanoate depolymerase n=1 Tax=Rhodopila sp. TaxID=2480087 RepID=UPI002B9FAF20|nr:plasmid partitioning protein [Rhodopila sp.]HVZ08240.1 plasmid partitioning protein [Rhodopila sp.]